MENVNFQNRINIQNTNIPCSVNNVENTVYVTVRFRSMNRLINSSKSVKLVVFNWEVGVRRE